MASFKRQTQEGWADTILSEPTDRVFSLVDASAEQREKIRGLLQEKESLRVQEHHLIGPIVFEAAEKALLVLTREQRKKLEDNVYRNIW